MYLLVSCTDCFLFYDGRCYTGYLSTNLTHSQAADSCIENDNYLTSILSPLFTQILDNSNLTFWIGLQDVFSNGTLEWIDGSDFNYTNLNSTNTERTECILADYHGSTSWNYADCNDTHFYFCSAGGTYASTFDSVNQSILYSLYLTCFSFVVITSPPYNLVVSDLTYSSLVLSWDEIPLTERHAPILGYIISYSEVSSGSTEIEVQINSSSLSVTIENLQFGVTYNFTIRASGALGDSPVSSVETTTPFKGTFVVFYSESCCLLNYLRALYRITESNSTLRNIFFFCYPMV